jgi:hypothetical protein
MSTVHRGTVTKLNSSINISGGENNSGITTRYHTTFLLDGVTVLFTSGAAPVINEGDQLMVAGSQQGRVLKAYAYRNLSMHVIGNEGTWKRLGEALVCLMLAGISLWLFYSFLFVPNKYHSTADTVIGIIAGAASVALIGGSLYYLYRWSKVSRAVKMLKEHY